MTNSTPGPARRHFISAVSAGIMMLGGSLCVAGMSMADTIDNPNPTVNTEAPRFTPIAPAEAPRFTPIAPADGVAPFLRSRSTPTAPAHEAPLGKAVGKSAPGQGDSRGGHSRGAR